MALSLSKKAAAYVRAKLINEPTGHDWFHAERVWKMAQKLQAEEGGDLELISLVALMHDLGDDQVFEFNQTKGSLVLAGMMDVLDIDSEKKAKIVKAISELQYNGPRTAVPSTLEAKIVRDADWLDDLGALGVARVFATGGYIRRVLHNPRHPLRKDITGELNRKTKTEGTSFNYFYEKMFQLPDLMLTNTGKRLAKRRVAYIRSFLEEFLAEWRGEH